MKKCHPAQRAASGADYIAASPPLLSRSVGRSYSG
jgi:hypothetical protein